MTHFEQQRAIFGPKGFGKRYYLVTIQQRGLWKRIKIGRVCFYQCKL